MRVVTACAAYTVIECARATAAGALVVVQRCSALWMCPGGLFMMERDVFDLLQSHVEVTE